VLTVTVSGQGIGNPNYYKNRNGNRWQYCIYPREPNFPKTSPKNNLGHRPTRELKCGQTIYFPCAEHQQKKVHGKEVTLIEII